MVGLESSRRGEVLVVGVGQQDRCVKGLRDVLEG